MSAKSKSRNKKKEEKKKPRLKEKMTEVLELPKEVVLNVPKLTMIGGDSLVIENYKGVTEYESDKIRVNTGTGTIKVTGEMLSIKEITSEDIVINGKVRMLEFLD